MKKKARGLTAREKFVVREMGLTKIYRYSRRNNLDWDSRWQERTPTEVRRIIASREEDSERQQKAYALLQKAMVNVQKWDEVENAFYEFKRALKYQGYLKMKYVVAMARSEGKSDQELEQMMLLEAL